MYKKNLRGWVPSNLDLSWKNLSIIGQFMALIEWLAVMVIHCILKGMDFFVERAINTDKKRPNSNFSQTYLQVIVFLCVLF